MAMDSSGKTVWTGSLLEGSGTIAGAPSGAFGALDVTWGSRTEAPSGRTSPEELIAAAWSSCFSMALAHALAGAGTPPERLETSVTLTFQPGEGIVKAAFTVIGIVSGLDQDAFREQAEGAKVNCPVSKAMTGVPEVTVEATLAAPQGG
jgi:osmotically inducible protein OsmC